MGVSKNRGFSPSKMDGVYNLLMVPKLIQMDDLGGVKTQLTQPMDPEKKSLNFIFPTKYVIPKSSKG